MALQCLIKNYLQIPDVIVVRLGRGIQNLKTYKDATQLTLIYWTSDEHPDLYVMELPNTDIPDIPRTTGHNKNKLRIMLLIQKSGNDATIVDCDDLADSLMPNTQGSPAGDMEGDDAESDNGLSTIPEGDEEDAASESEDAITSRSLQRRAGV